MSFHKFFKNTPEKRSEMWVVVKWADKSRRGQRVHFLIFKDFYRAYPKTPQKMCVVVKGTDKSR